MELLQQYLKQMGRWGERNKLNHNRLTTKTQQQGKRKQRNVYNIILERRKLVLLTNAPQHMSEQGTTAGQPTPWK